MRLNNSVESVSMSWDRFISDIVFITDM